MLLTALSFIFVLGILVFFHELGHFLVAKRAGIYVEKFSLGFPPNIFSRTIGETTYCIGIIPLGGYVKMLGENPEEGHGNDPREFMAQSVGKRAAVIFAGPLMNYLLAILLLIGIFYFGGRPVTDSDRILVGEVVADAPAEKAGLRPDDQIIAIDGYAVSTFDSLRVRINAKVEESLELTWLRGGDTMTANIVTRSEQLPNLEGGLDTVGVIGFGEKIVGYENYGAWESIKRGFSTTHVIVYETVRFVKRVVTGEVSSKLIGGPIFIAQQSGREAEKGASNLFFFMALLSVNLAVLNVLPIPILDGGQLVFLLAEKVKGSPLSVRARAIAQQVGLVFLLSLIVFVTYNDILRVFRGF